MPDSLYTPNHPRYIMRKALFFIAAFVGIIATISLPTLAQADGPVSARTCADSVRCGRPA